MAQFRTSRKFDAAFLLVLGVLLALAWFNRVAVGDWVYFLNYHPTAETIQAADEAGLSPYGRHLLYRTNPQFADLATVNAACDVEHLGCLTPHGQAFILTDAASPAGSVVTAAHEMLHIAYQRLTPATKADIAPLLDAAISQNLIIGLGDELSNETSLADRRDEAHSLLGTEYRHIPPGLENYYARYFADRTKVLAEYTASQK